MIHSLQIIMMMKVVRKMVKIRVCIILCNIVGNVTLEVKNEAEVFLYFYCS
jgi:hypothetical protein